MSRRGWCKQFIPVPHRIYEAFNQKTSLEDIARQLHQKCRRVSTVTPVKQPCSRNTSRKFSCFEVVVMEWACWMATQAFKRPTLYTVFKCSKHCMRGSKRQELVLLGLPRDAIATSRDAFSFADQQPAPSSQAASAPS